MVLIPYRVIPRGTPPYREFVDYCLAQRWPLVDYIAPGPGQSRTLVFETESGDTQTHFSFDEDVLPHVVIVGAQRNEVYRRLESNIQTVQDEEILTAIDLAEGGLAKASAIAVAGVAASGPDPAPRLLEAVGAALESSDDETRRGAVIAAEFALWPEYRAPLERVGDATSGELRERVLGLLQRWEELVRRRTPQDAAIPSDATAVPTRQPPTLDSRSSHRVVPRIPLEEMLRTLFEDGYLLGFVQLHPFALWFRSSGTDEGLWLVPDDERGLTYVATSEEKTRDVWFARLNGLGVDLLADLWARATGVEQAERVLVLLGIACPPGGSSETRRVFLEALDDPNIGVRAAAIEAAPWTTDPEIARALAKHDDSNPELADVAKRVAQRMLTPGAK